MLHLRCVAIVALLVAACGAATVSSSGPTAELSPDGAQPGPAALELARDHARRMRATPSETECGRIEGSVFRPDGSPLAGAEVTLWLDRDCRDDDPARVLSDRKGRFVFDDIPFDTDTPWVSAHFDGLASNGAHVELTRDAPRATCELHLEEYAWVDLVVAMPDGAPAATCDIRVNGHSDAPVALDANGRGVVSLDQDGSVTLTGIVAPYPAARATVDVVRGERQTVRLTIDRGVALAGRVVDDQGAPVVATVRACHVDWSYLPPVEATSGAEGGFQLTRLASSPYDITVEAAGHETVKVCGLTPAEDTPLNVVLRRDGAVALRLGVLDSMTSPTSVELCGERLCGDGVMNERIEWPGTAAPFALTAGRWHFVVSAKGFARYDREIDIAPGSTVDLGRVELDPGVDFVGVVVDATGHPVVDADVETDWSRKTKTDATGRFVFEHSPRRPMEVRIYGNAFVPRSVTADPTAGPAAISLIHGAVVRGTAADADGSPVWWSVKARLRRRDVAGWDVDASIENDGTFSARITPGPWTVELVQKDEVLATRDVNLGEGDEVCVALVVAPR